MGSLHSYTKEGQAERERAGHVHGFVHDISTASFREEGDIS